MLPSFFVYALPQKFKDVHLDKVGYRVDGKVYMTEYSFMDGADILFYI